MNQTVKSYTGERKSPRSRAQHDVMPNQILAFMCLAGSVGFITLAFSTQDALTRQFSIAMAIIGFALFSSSLATHKK